MLDFNYIGAGFLFGFNVRFGLKKEIELGDVFAATLLDVPEAFSVVHLEFGSQRRTGPPRSHSSSKSGNFRVSA